MLTCLQGQCLHDLQTTPTPNAVVLEFKFLTHEPYSGATLKPKNPIDSKGFPNQEDTCNLIRPLDPRGQGDQSQ